jgi:hypothetical protein
VALAARHGPGAASLWDACDGPETSGAAASFTSLACACGSDRGARGCSRTSGGGTAGQGDHVRPHRRRAASYAAVKRRLFLGDGRAVAPAVVNTGEAFGRALALDLEALGTRVGRVGAGDDADYRLLEARSDVAGARVRAVVPGDELILGTRLPGRHNAENALAAADPLGLHRDTVLDVLAAFPACRDAGSAWPRATRSRSWSTSPIPRPPSARC